MIKKTLLIGLILFGIISCNRKYETNADKNTITQVPEEPGSGNPSTGLGNVTDSAGTLDLKYSFTQLDNTMGLSNSSVNAIFQDSDNILWIGTWDGLNRYDGSKFKIFRPDINNDNSLSNQVILKIDEDNTGHIWVLTMHGINKYNKKTNTFQRYFFSNKKNQPLSESEFNMALDASKTVFCAVKDWGIGYYLNNGFQQMEFEHLPEEAVKKMIINTSGDLLVLFENNQLHLLEIKTRNNGEKYISQSELISDNVRDFEILQNQKICVISKKGTAKVHSLTDRDSLGIIQEGVQNIIGVTPDGLMLSNTSEFIIVDSLGNHVKKSWIKFLKGKKVTTILHGSENVLWIGTDGDGIFKLYPLQKSFNLISKNQVSEFSEGIVRAFTEIKGNSFWVGTKGKGLFRFPADFYENNNSSLKYTNFNESNSNINNAVFALHSGRDSLMFIGTDGNGIDVFDLKKSKLVSWAKILGSTECEYFKSTYTIYQDKKGYLWIGTNGFGMIRLKIERSGEELRVIEFKKYTADNVEGKSLSSNVVFSIIPKNEDELWIGTRLGGLNILNKKSGLVKVFVNKKSDSESISSNDILCLSTDSMNRLWVGTSFGLNLLEEFKDNGEAVFKRFTVKEGLPNNTIHGIVPDIDNNLWISTNFGLSKFILDESKFINFIKNDGLQNNEFADGAFYKSLASDFIFMGGIKGFNFFLPWKIKESTYVPDILIDDISGQNKEIPYYQSLVVSSESNSIPSIVLDHDQNYFDVELAVLTYINSEKCQYAYQLSGFDREWVNIGNRRNISFTNVPPKNYSLWLKWTNSDGIWSDPIQAIDIEIKPIFWRSDLAILLYVILSVLFLVFIWSYFNKRNKLRQNILFQKREEEIHQKRITFFTNIAHEFQTPLTLIIGPVQKLSESFEISTKNQRFIKMIQSNSSRLLFLTQQLLEFRKAEEDYLDVTVKRFDLVDVLEQIAELFDEWALKKKIDFVVTIPSEIIGWFDKDKIEKIVFNLLSNAFKYTPEKGKIQLIFTIEGATNNSKELKIKVMNSGKGIPKNKLDSLFNRFSSTDIMKSSEHELFRTGIGLAYIYRLVQVMRGTIQVFSKENRQTTFTVSLPCSREMFRENEMDSDEGEVFISHYLQNVLEALPTEKDNSLNKVSALESILSKRKKVLVVEDHGEMHGLLKELLADKYTVLTAYNGQEAFEIAENQLPDIIVSDVVMPVMDGIELCKKIKRETKTCHIPFIMLTASSSVTSRIKGLESGANSFIPKPFHPDHLMVRIEKLLEERELMFKHFNKDVYGDNLYDLPIGNEDKDFINKVIDIIRDNIDNDNLQSKLIEKELGISSSQLYRKIKKITGLSQGDLIRTTRLKHAADLLKKNTLTVSEVCYQSGFNNRSYFYREFNKMYNITPKNYQIKYSPKLN
ncbi:hybrid sensor histidine kinase/response regulator transcription factor [Maribacter polysiphoniae]|uniref:histidine kinase n=2 Tax=Maribacter polysiphoniae TaxID=429344 RepID=A0A316EFA3_9FLAO|nr:two-component regulator propeller domain-containing protein [Maribacter polysiphoniae]PWK21600.1 two component regulator with propeller domain [Maribacter polysiphoniae]